MTKTWKIKSIELKPQYAGQTDVVSNVVWELDAIEGDHIITTSGFITLEFDENKPYIPYDQLTEAQVIEWVKEALGPAAVAMYENNIEIQLNNIINPPVVRVENPWGSP